MDPAGINTNRFGQPVLGDVHGPEKFFVQNLTGVNGGEFHTKDHSAPLAQVSYFSIDSGTTMQYYIVP